MGVLKTVMHYGYSGISRERNLLSEDIYPLYFQVTFLCSIPDTIQILRSNSLQFLEEKLQGLRFFSMENAQDRITINAGL